MVYSKRKFYRITTAQLMEKAVLIIKAVQTFQTYKYLYSYNWKKSCPVENTSATHCATISLSSAPSSKKDQNHS